MAKTIDGKKVNVDLIIRELKHNGRYNLIQLIILSLNMLSQPANILAILFIGMKPDFQCRAYDNSSILPNEIQELMSSSSSNNATWLEYGQCSVNVISSNTLTNSTILSLPCTNGYTYVQPKSNSFISEWDLVCGKRAFGALSQTILVIGMTVGAFVIPYFADRCGRRPVIIFCQAAIWVCSFAVVFIPSLVPFLVLRFFIGCFEQGYSVPTATLALEIFPTERRAFISMIRGVNWSLSCLVLGMSGYFMRNYNWRYFALLVSFTATVFIIDILFLKESLRWLFVNNRLDRAKDIIRHATKMNNIDFDPIWHKHVEIAGEECVKCDILNDKTTTIPLMSSNNEKESELEKSTSINSLFTIEPPPITIENTTEYNVTPEEPRSNTDNPSSLTLFTDPALRGIMMIQIYCWAINSMSYYGIYLAVTSLSGNKYFNFLVTAACELVTMTSVWKSFMWFGRKKALIGYLLIGSVSQFAAIFINLYVDKDSKYVSLEIVASTLGMFGVSGAFSAIWGYLPELIPTNYRNSAVGFSSCAARVGSAVSPFTLLVVSIIPWVPPAIFSGGLFLACVLVLLLPETRGRQMPQCIDDVRAWSREKKSQDE
ncbi:cation transporter 3-like [Octopus vulgaris]|uniref:Cation transporter 3-like n=1 Tax=Octopus vulgaris TaxID=6645 RepID=A0AA36BCN8_OCTVU|nr:cation transporter 3-like [Octopus vulgaris]